MYDPKTRAHYCDECRRMMNPTDSLTQLHNRDTGRSKGVCPAKGCWDSANAQGYLSSVQREKLDERG